MTTQPHTTCRQELATRLAGMGLEVTISTEQPLVVGPYTQGMTCPHDVTYWFEPTGEQIAQWARDGVQ